MSLKKFGVRAAVTGLAAAALVFLPAVAASAHVRVEPDGTAAGSYSQLTFRVPNESPDATTTKLVVKLPTKHPFTSVSVNPTTGWKAHVKQARLPKPVTVDGAKITKAPRTVTWTATKGHDIKQNEYRTFTIMVGPLPKPGVTETMPAKQTYSDGEVVSWSQTPKPGSEEPEHPAPEFTTTESDSSGSSGSSGTSGSNHSSSHSSMNGPMSGMKGMDMSHSTAAADDTARWLGGIGIALGIIAVFVALFRRDAPPPGGSESEVPSRDSDASSREDD